MACIQSAGNDMISVPLKNNVTLITPVLSATLEIWYYIGKSTEIQNNIC